jgi:uncharacterized protein
MRNWFKKAVYFIVVVWVSSSHAGSYEDFFTALMRNDPATVTALLDRGFDPNARDPKGQTGLAVALRSEARQAAMALVSHPSLDVNALNDAGESALMLVVIRGDIDLARRLLERGAKVNQPGWAPLHYAASGPEVRLIELLLDRGADIDAGSPNGSTALMMAARYGSEAGVELLLKRGADAKRRNERRLTAADFAREAGRVPLAERLAALAR